MKTDINKRNETFYKFYFLGYPKSVILTDLGGMRGPPYTSVGFIVVQTSKQSSVFNYA